MPLSLLPNYNLPLHQSQKKEDVKWPFQVDQEMNYFISYHHHHHHVVLVARISLTLSRHFSLSFIPSGRSSGLHLVSSHSCWMYVRAGRPAFARPYVGVYKSTSLMSSSVLLQKCAACLVHLTWIVFVIRGRWPYSWCLVGCCRQDLFKIARSILHLDSFPDRRQVAVQLVCCGVLSPGLVQDCSQHSYLI